MTGLHRLFRRMFYCSRQRHRLHLRQEGQTILSLCRDCDYGQRQYFHPERWQESINIVLPEYGGRILEE